MAGRTGGDRSALHARKSFRGLSQKLLPVQRRVWRFWRNNGDPHIDLFFRMRPGLGCLPVRRANRRDSAWTTEPPLKADKDRLNFFTGVLRLRPNNSYPPNADPLSRKK